MSGSTVPYSFALTLGENSSHQIQAQHAYAALAETASSSDELLAQILSLESVLESGEDEATVVATVVTRLREVVAAARSHRELLQLNNCNVTSAISSLLGRLMTFTTQNSQLRALRAELEQEIRTLKSEVAELKVEMSTLRHTVLLGQLAYVIDDAVAEYVMGPNRKRNLTIKEVQKSSKNADQQRRWEEIVQYIGLNNHDLGDVFRSTKILRDGRGQAAHGSDAEQRNATGDQLRQWATTILAPRFMPEFEEVMEVVRLFADPDHPLVRKPASDVVRSVRAALNA